MVSPTFEVITTIAIGDDLTCSTIIAAGDHVVLWESKESGKRIDRRLAKEVRKVIERGESTFI